MRVQIAVHHAGAHERAYLDTEEGARLDALASTLAADGVAHAADRRIVYEPADEATAPLFRLQGVPETSAFEPAPKRRARCPLCGQARLRDIPPGGYRTQPEAFGTHDLLRSNQEWLVSARLGERLRDRRGALLVPLRGATGYLLRPVPSVGWPVDGTAWDDPCDVCHQRSGHVGPDFVAGLHTYASATWHGDDVVGASGMPHALLVSRGVRRLLQEPTWRIPGLSFVPVALVGT